MLLHVPAQSTVFLVAIYLCLTLLSLASNSALTLLGHATKASFDMQSRVTPAPLSYPCFLFLRFAVKQRYH